MSTKIAGAPEAAPAHTKESLFPEGWEKTLDQPEAAAESEDETEQETTEDGEDLAEAQGATGEGDESEQEQEAALGRMELNDFLRETGITHEEFYHDIYKVEDGKEVSMSAAWDERKRLQEANDALIRERGELQERVNQTATHVQQPGWSPEAQTLANQAQMKMQQIAETDWSQLDPGQAANIKFDLQAQAQHLWAQAQQKQGEHQQALQKHMQEAMAEADRQTRALIPEWNDQGVRTTEWKSIGDMLNPYGIRQEELDTVVDPRWRRFFRDALQSRREKARIQAGAKKLRKVGKTLGGGARAAMKKTPTLEGAKHALTKARKDGASKSQLEAMRLQVELPELPKRARRRS